MRLSWTWPSVLRMLTFFITTESTTAAVGTAPAALGLEALVLRCHPNAAANSNRTVAVIGRRDFMEGGWPSVDAGDAPW